MPILSKKIFNWSRYYTIIIFVFTVVFVQLIAGLLLIKFLPTWEDRGAFGEMFIVVHTLFDGLAFVALVITILNQQSEIKSQNFETQRVIIVQKTLVEVLAITAQLNAQYSILDSRNRSHDRSLANNLSREELNNEIESIGEIEKQISTSTEMLKMLLSDIKKIPTDLEELA
ncbi:MAG: hypothetical protein LUM44_21355 [Pyrinomonadaceae bacterium]|nr:hypothetical protein [Pyrinomonadaceae bacterium]